MMKRLRILGLMLMVVFALGGVAAATALAVEAGVLTLKEETELKVDHELLNAKKETTPEANVVKLVFSAGTVECKKLWVLSASVTVADKKTLDLNQRPRPTHQRMRIPGIEMQHRER
jgi:hypothetical protein